MANPKEKTPMCLVNELARFNKVQPEYKLLSEQGPAHSKVIQPLWRDSLQYAFLFFLPASQNHRSSLSCLPVSSFKIFSVRLTLGEQQWEAEGTSIKKAQHSAAAAALAETTLPKPTMRMPRNTGKNPGGRLPLSLTAVAPYTYLHAAATLRCSPGRRSLAFLHSRWHDAHNGTKCTMYEDREKAFV